MKVWRKRIGMIAALALLLCMFAAVAEPTMKETVKGGKVVRREWTDESGALTPGPEGYAYMTRSISGTTVTEKFYDAEGNPVMVTGGYYGQMLTYGNRHRLEEVVYLDQDGRKAECAQGYARLRIVYTSKGMVTSAGYYDRNNDLVMVPGLGYAAVRSEYRGSAATKTTYLDDQKRPVDIPQGYAVRIQTVNKSNRITSIRFEHADGSPAVCAEGWASCKRELDKKNREVSIKYYDLAGQLIIQDGGYAYEEREWDGDDSCTLSRYDASGNRITLAGGAEKIRQDYSKDGQIIRETCLNATGKANPDDEGVAVRTYLYDGEGHLVQTRFADASGRATMSRGGYAGYSETLDADGFRTVRTYVDTEGKAVNTAEGYSEIRYVYDASRQITAREYYDVNGTLIKKD